ncbi:hypothetical protein F5B17DRAFT_442267 [Nemania serpens]|nr:hypothetical protein F5B17DRAFT_442267 [Nemania serpens]
MACRIPGGITTPEEYWELLENGGDAITDVPEDRWNADAIYDPNPEASGKSYCRQGGFMSVDSFDAAFFGISPREVQSLDPMQYIMLETCWEALERAGYTNEQLRGNLDGYAGTGSAGATISGRVSYFLGVEGPTMTVDTACSSSLVTTHLACTALRQGECDIAVSGGISLLLSPGTLHVNNEPTPAVDWKGANMALVQERQPWLPRKDRLRRAGVSAFGIGGTNAHVIVQEAPKHAVRSSPLAPLPPVVPLVISGNTDAALSRQAEKLRLHLSRRTDRLGDVAYSLATARSHFRRRLALMAHDKEEALEKLAAVAIGTRPNPGVHAATPRLVMLFTGQGSQVAGMGKDLARNYPVFREALDEIMAQFVGLDRPLLDVMWADTESDSGAGVLLQHTDYAQPALFAFEVALWRLWTSWGVWPDLLFGHSIGELAVAHVAGVMDLADACRLASVAEVRAAIENFGLGNKVSIASHNGPTQTVASGDGDAIEKLGAYFTAQNRRAKTLKVSHAFHSHHMDGMLADFQSIAETVRFHPPTSPIVSGLTGQLATPGLLEKPGYWVQQARNAVRFSDGIQTLASQGINIALELGPQPVLCGMGTACLAGNGVTDQDINTVAWLPTALPSCMYDMYPLTGLPRQWKMDTSTISPDDTANQSPKQAYWRWDLRDALMDATSVRQAKIMQDMVRETVAGILGFTSPDAVDAELPLRDLGIDSLTAALLWTRLATLTSLALPAMVAFDHPNLRALSQYLLNQLQESWKDASTTTQESDDATPTTAASTSPGDISVDNIPIIGTDSVAIAQHRLVHWKKCPNLSSIAPLYRVLSPPLGLNPPNTSSQRFLSALGYFSSLPWCSRLIYDSSPMSGLLPGYGQAIPFIPQCFNPASLRHDQFIGNTLSHDKTIANSINDTNGINHNKSASRGPPLRHMLSLIRPSDASHLEDATRHIPRVASLYALGDGTSGFEGILHGGLTTTLLDESLNIVHEINTALGKTCGVFAGISVTASLNVRFVAPVATTEEAICVTAWVEEIRGRYTTLKAELTNGEGDRLAEAEGVFAGVESSTSTVKS